MEKEEVGLGEGLYLCAALAKVTTSTTLGRLHTYLR